MPDVSLTSLQQQIAQREHELKALRQQLESRQSHLNDLTRRKEELRSQLQHVEQEIAALAASATATQRAAPDAAPSPVPAAPRGGQTLLGELIVTLLREASGAMTARQLSEEAQRRGLQPRSSNPLKAVEARLQELKNKGLVRRASGQPGYVLVPSANSASKRKNQTRPPGQTGAAKASAKPAETKATTKEGDRKRTPPVAAAMPAKAGRGGEQAPLREIVTDLLRKSRQPMSARHLAEQILASGFRSESKKFVKVIHTTINKMKTVEYVPDQGYRLKKS
ncbi:MAG: hypothetical protein ACYC3I_00865 [Gemmataceae bacterium]